MKLSNRLFWTALFLALGLAVSLGSLKLLDWNAVFFLALGLGLSLLFFTVPPSRRPKPGGQKGRLGLRGTPTSRALERKRCLYTGP